MEIILDKISMVYPNGKMALNDISLGLNSPNLVGLIGPNGAGKTTLMKLLSAGLLPTSGKIQVDGKPLHNQEKEFKHQLGYLPQSFGLYNDLTVWQFLDYMAALKGISQSKAEVDRVIAKTNLQEKRKAKIHTLSGGQRQRVGIAQAILGEPEFLIFDEPTVGLDPEERISFRNLFSEISQNKIVLLSTHIIEDVQSVCNRLIVIHEGTIRFCGTPSELIQAAEGHVGVFLEGNDTIPDSDCHITTKVNTADGVLCRVVGKNLPQFAKLVSPTLEDAYLYLIEVQGEGIDSI